MVYSALSNSTTRSQFTRRKGITITTDGTSTPVNYQVKLTITHEAEMQADFDDIRFNTRAGGYIDYWVESYVASTSAVVWVELPDAVTDPGSDYIWMYHGNSELSDGSNGADTFVQYHGAASTNYHDTNIINGVFKYKSKFRTTTSGAHNHLIGIADRVDPHVAGDGYTFQSHYNDDLVRTRSYDEGNTSVVGEAPALTQNTWYIIDLVYDGTNLYGYVDDNQISTYVSSNIPDEACGLFLNNLGNTGEQEYSFVHKYIANEPTPSYGTTQHQRRTPQFIG